MKEAELNTRQGDVNFFKIDEFPEGERTQDKQCTDAILAYGELTGHCHEVEDKTSVEVFRILGDLYLNALKDVTIRHGRIKGFEKKEADQDYHNEVKLPAGKYFIGIVEETDHIGKLVRRVLD